MADAHQQALDFWFDFDERSLWQRDERLTNAIGTIINAIPGPPLDNIVSLFRGAVSAGTYPAAFEQTVQKAAAAFREVALFQMEILEQHFQGDIEAMQYAFAAFGQGVLYDHRRAAHPKYTGCRIHMMDGSPENWVGYHRWHAMIRAQVYCGAQLSNWLEVARCVAMAWTIQTEANPEPDNEANPGLSQERIAAHRGRWRSASWENIDEAFFRYQQQGPMIDGHQLPFKSVDVSAPTYADVSRILSEAAAGSSPIHQNHRRFWELPYAEFMNIGQLYGVDLIAGPGSGRGANSGLVLALKGLPPFGPGGFPRMPKDRPPVTESNIAFIERWIDLGCPE